jgi:hypothetical protein
MDRNVLLESSPAAQGRFRVRQQAAMTEVRESADRLVALSDSPERRAANQGLRQNVDAFFAILDRIGALAASQRGEEAFRVARDEGLPARTKLNEWLQARTAILAGELQDAKARATEEAEMGTRMLIGLLRSASSPQGPLQA